MRVPLAYRPAKITCQRDVWWSNAGIAYHRIDEFDTVIFGGVVACCNHDTDRRIALLGAETRDHSDSEHDMIEAICTVLQLVSHCPVAFSKLYYGSGLRLRGRAYAFMRNC
jgi:hypothetical protein